HHGFSRQVLREAVVPERGVILPGDDSIGVCGYLSRTPCAFHYRAHFTSWRQEAVARRSLAVFEVCRVWRCQNAGWTEAPAACSCARRRVRIDADGAVAAVADGPIRRIQIVCVK